MEVFIVITSQQSPGTTFGNHISDWSIGEKRIDLYRESQANYLTFRDQSTGKTTKFRTSLYDISYAVSLVSLFHKTIGENLRKDTPNSACFLPKLCIEVHDGIQVALFGRVDTQTNVRGELKGMRWGVFNSSTRVEQTFDVDEDDSVARLFVRHAPSTNQPHMIEVGHDDLNKPIMKPAVNHYAMTAYAKSFNIVLTLDIAKRIQKVALHHVSLLDRNVILSENVWSVTLVSALQSTQSLFSSLFTRFAGHAMLACEGIEHGRKFLRYIHFTQAPRNKNVSLEGDEGLIEKYDREVPHNTMNGPTIRRLRSAVQHMFAFVDTVEGTPLKFSLYKGQFGLSDALGFGFNVEDQNGVDWRRCFDGAWAIIHSNQPETCLQCADRIAAYAGIDFQGNRTPMTPLQRIEIVKRVPIFQMPNGFNYQLLGSPLPETYRELSMQMLSQSILLTPDDCPPADFSKWIRQAVIEASAALAKELNSINANPLRIFTASWPKNW